MDLVTERSETSSPDFMSLQTIRSPNEKTQKPMTIEQMRSEIMSINKNTASIMKMINKQRSDDYDSVRDISDINSFHISEDEKWNTEYGKQYLSDTVHSP